MVKGQAGDDDIKGVICKRQSLDRLDTKIYCTPYACRLLKWDGLPVVWRPSFVNLCCSGCANFLRETNEELNLSLFPSP